MSNERYLIVGLGNPGKDYENTRHNIGFQVIEALAAAYRLKFDQKKSKARYADGVIVGKRVIIVKPQTYMNLSGNAVRGLMDFYKIPVEHLMVISDDLDTPLGMLRIRPKGGAGGQKGLRHIIQQVGTQDFARTKLGIGRPPGKMDPARYVLRPFKGDDAILATETIDRAVKAIEIWLQDGIDAAMNRQNGTAEDVAARLAKQSSPKVKRRSRKSKRKFVEMKYNRLGNTGLLVSELALGTMIFGETRDRSTPADEAARIIKRFIDAGGNHIDTADVYADGRSEEIVGKIIKPQRDQIVLATKVRFPCGQGPNEVGLSRHHIIEGVNASLRRLDTDYIDLYYMHAWDPLTPIEESLRAFDDLVAAGKVRYVGVSNFKAWQLMKSLAVSDANSWARFVAAQYQYSLVKRDIEYEFTDLLATEGVGLCPWGALGGGFLSGKYTPDQRPDEGRISTTPGHEEESWERRNVERNWNIIDAMGQITEAHNATYSQVALAWVRQQPSIASVIIGVRTMAQLEDNLKSSTVTLSTAEMSRLDAASTLPELYPYRFITAYAERKI